jgi:hypothetical protein
MADARPMTAKEARDKAEECRCLARKTTNQEHRTILNQMAEAWEQIAAGK